VLLISFIPFSIVNAFCVYNQTNYNVDFSISAHGYKALNVGKWSESTKKPMNCWGYGDIGNGSRTQILSVEVHIKSIQFNCVIGMQAGGYLKVNYHKEENGLNNTVTVTSYTFDHNVYAVLPNVSKPGNRDVQFLATADPQFIKGNIEAKNEPWQQAASVLKKLKSEVSSSKNRGIIIAGDLTAWSRTMEWQEYEKYTSGFHRYLYDGLGNHDFEEGNCCNGSGSLRGGNLLAWNDACICPEEIAKAIGDRLRSTPLSGRSGPNYSWDWHDVHFVQLNLFPGNGTKDGKYNTYNSLNFLKSDLAKNVGSSGRPVVLIHHYGMEGFSRGCGVSDTDTDLDGCIRNSDVWWTQTERIAYWNAIANYNVPLIITGHLHNTGGNQWWQTKWKRPKGLSNGPSEIQTITAGGAKDGGYYTSFRITNDKIQLNRYQAGNLNQSLSGTTFSNVGSLTFDISKPGEKPSHLNPQVKPVADNQTVTIVNTFDTRFLFDPGKPFVGARGSEGGWTSSPKIIATDANYYNKGTWYLEKNSDGTFFIINKETKRYLFCPGTVFNGKPGNEGGWTNAKQMVGTDDNYYNRAKWIIKKTGNGIYTLENKETHRLLFSTGEKPKQSEGGWTKSPKCVGTDSNYYNKAQWKISGQGVSLLN
jgi:hypothetical protein